MSATVTACKHQRGTSNSNSRGSSKDREARRHYLVHRYGDGQVAGLRTTCQDRHCGATCTCVFCGVELDANTLSVDRIVPGIEGGRYTRDNTRPACLPCNAADGARIGHARTQVRRQLAMAG